MRVPPNGLNAVSESFHIFCEYDEGVIKGKAEGTGFCGTGIMCDRVSVRLTRSNVGFLTEGLGRQGLLRFGTNHNCYVSWPCDRWSYCDCGVPNDESNGIQPKANTQPQVCKATRKNPYHLTTPNRSWEDKVSKVHCSTLVSMQKAMICREGISIS